VLESARARLPSCGAASGASEAMLPSGASVACITASLNCAVTPAVDCSASRTLSMP